MIHTKAEKVIFSFISIFACFAAANILTFLVRSEYADAGNEVGFPITFYTSAGFFSKSMFLPNYLAANVAIALAAAVLVAAIVKWVKLDKGSA